MFTILSGKAGALRIELNALCERSKATIADETLSLNEKINKLSRIVTDLLEYKANRVVRTHSSYLAAIYFLVAEVYVDAMMLAKKENIDHLYLSTYKEIKQCLKTIDCIYATDREAGRIPEYELIASLNSYKISDTKEALK